MLKLRLVTNARDQGEVPRFDLSIDRIFRNVVSNTFAMPTLAPNVANLDQRPISTDNPGKLEPGLNRRSHIVQQAVQSRDWCNRLDSPFLVGVVQIPSDVPDGFINIDPAALHETDFGIMSKKRIQGPRPVVPSLSLPRSRTAIEGIP